MVILQVSLPSVLAVQMFQVFFRLTGRINSSLCFFLRGVGEVLGNMLLKLQMLLCRVCGVFEQLRNSETKVPQTRVFVVPAAEVVRSSLFASLIPADPK